MYTIINPFSKMYTLQVQRELSLADKEMNELESEVYKYLEAKRELQEEIDDIVDNLIKKKLMLCELEDKRLSISLQTQVDELTSSLSEAVTRTEETNMTLGHVQNEYKKSVENIKLKKVLMVSYRALYTEWYLYNNYGIVP